MNILRNTGVFRKLAGLLLLCAVVAPLGTRVSAQTGGGVKLEAQAGLGGVCKSGAWIPIRVSVENTSADFDARVELSHKNYQGGTSIYAADISLPATSRKEIFLYARSTSVWNNVYVKVWDGNTERARKPLNVSCGMDEDLYFGVLSDTPVAYNILNAIRPLRVGSTHLARLTLNDLPDQPQGWDTFNALVISNVDTGKMTAAQKRALQLWVVNGGKLFITGGTRWQTTTAGLQEILPLDISVTKNVAGFSALSEYIKDASPLEGEAALASGKILEGAHILVTQDGLPLLVEKKIGYGKVYYFAADPALQPLRNWDGMKDVYEHLLAFTPQKPSWAGAQWETTSANSALSSLPELDLPSFLYICCWLGVYILAIGPVNYLILRRIKRTELAWVTIPVLVIVFSCAAYLFGFAYRGFTPILNRLALAQGWDGVPQMRVNDLVGIYSPSRASYTVQAREQFMLYSPYGMDTNVQGNQDWIQVKTNDGTSLPGVRVEIGGMTSVGAEGYASAFDIQHDLTLTLTKKNPTLTGTITNISGHTLRGAVLVTPSEWRVLGDLKPNQSKKISISILDMSGVLDVYNIFNTIGLPVYSYGAEDKEVMRRSSFLRASLSNYGGEIPNVTGFYLMGWLEDISAPVDLQGQKTDAVDTMLYFQKLEPYVVTNPASFIITSSLYDWESSLGTLRANIPSSGYEIRFQLSEPVDFSKVDFLTLNIVSSNSAPNTMLVYLWNFRTKTWDDIPDTVFFNVPNSSQYVGADGEIRMRLEVAPNSYAQFDIINFKLGVTP